MLCYKDGIGQPKLSYLAITTPTCLTNVTQHNATGRNFRHKIPERTGFDAELLVSFPLGTTNFHESGAAFLSCGLPRSSRHILYTSGLPVAFVNPIEDTLGPRSNRAYPGSNCRVPPKKYFYASLQHLKRCARSREFAGLSEVGGQANMVVICPHGHDDMQICNMTGRRWRHVTRLPWGPPPFSCRQS